MDFTFLNFFRLDSIRAKVILSCSLLILVMAVTSFKAYVQVSKLKESELRETFRALQKQVMNIKLSSHEFILKDRNNVEFFSSGKSEYVGRYTEALDRYRKSSGSIKAELFKTGFTETDELDMLDKKIEQYDAVFREMELRIKERGIDSYGIIGDFDISLKKMYQFDFGSDNISLLRLKYFIREYQLNGSTNTIQQVSDETYRFSSQLDKYITDKQVEEVITALSGYEANFKKLVTSDSTLGLYTGKGLQEKLFKKMNEIDAMLQLAATDAKISATYNMIVSQTMISLAIILSSCFLLALVIYFLLQRQILVPIKKLNGIIQKLGNGIIPSYIPDYRNLELRSMVESLQKLCLGFRRTSEFAQKVGEGDFNVSFTKLSDEDVLGNALLRMHDNLKKANEGDRQRYWAAEGFTMVNGILQSGLKLQILAERCLARLVRYMGAKQGAMFILNNQNPESSYMELVSTFACEDIDPLQRVEPGENLIGQCWIEKKTVYMEAIPKGFVKISSGLGSAEPNHILIVPLIIHNEVFGIIELASFERFEKYQQVFLEDLGESIASTIYNQKVKERTNRLMEELQERVNA